MVRILPPQPTTVLRKGFEFKLTLMLVVSCSVDLSRIARLDTRVIPARTNPLADLAVAYAERGEIQRAGELLTDGPRRCARGRLP